ncbi:MAG: hypothetical protein V1890_08065 [Candidatus Zixiibacteriota bacterium]
MLKARVKGGVERLELTEKQSERLLQGGKVVLPRRGGGKWMIMPKEEAKIA